MGYILWVLAIAWSLFKQSLGHLIFVTWDTSCWALKMGCFQRSAGVHRVTAEHLGTSSSPSWENFFLQESAAVKMCMSRPDELTWVFCKVVVQVLMLPVHVLFCGVSFDIYFFRAWLMTHFLSCLSAHSGSS